MKEVDKNTDEYSLFLKYSKEIGMDPSMVQAAGGNTSLKQGNTMWVKASGKWLLDAQSNELMVPMSVSKIKEALETRSIEKAFSGAELALLKYAEKLTTTPNLMNESDVANLKNAGIPDEEILEANQIICYFNYVNRTINGLGVTTKGDTVGYYK